MTLMGSYYDRKTKMHDMHYSFFKDQKTIWMEMGGLYPLEHCNKKAIPCQAKKIAPAGDHRQGRSNANINIGNGPACQGEFAQF